MRKKFFRRARRFTRATAARKEEQGEHTHNSAGIEGNASGRDLTLVMTPKKGKREAIGSISLESRGSDRLTLGVVLTPEHWGKGLTTEATWAMVRTGFEITGVVEILANVRVENDASRRVLEACGFEVVSTGLKGAPARGRLVECHTFSLTREIWAESIEPWRPAFEAAPIETGRPA